MKNASIYNDNTLLQNSYIQILYNNTTYNNINSINVNSVTYLNQRPLCIFTMSLFLLIL